MVPLKRRKTSCHAGNPGTVAQGLNVKFPELFLFLLERKMGASRRGFLSQLCRKKGFQVEELFSGRVTHVVSEKNSAAEVGAWLDSQVRGPTPAPHLLDVSWFTESMQAGRPVQILDRHRLQDLQIDEEEEEEAAAVVFSVPSYACQRRTTLENHNSRLTDALALLAENAELSSEEGRGVAFRRAAAVLKCLPETVTDMKQLRGLPCLGGHSLRVIREVLENGASSEVESTKLSERFRALKVLTGIFGVGAKTADRWIRAGIHDLQQLRESGPALNRAQRAGLDHYDDLNTPLTRADADAVAKVVERAVTAVSPGAQTTLIGGFRRGKQSGHDVDFLITHPEEGREVGLMPRVVLCLEEQGLLLYQKTTRNSYLESEGGPGRPASNMDRFERCFSIFKLQQEQHQPGSETDNGAHGDQNLGSQARRWRAVRVDLVVSPIRQFAFALLGWTGSKLFERELRRWAGHERSMSLSSHALFDSKESRYLRATTEEEIFTHLGLEFIPPWERNA